jgi:hypothetical protein
MPFVEHKGLVAKGKEDNGPSCSLADALGKQELFVNPLIATFAAQFLWELFRHGGLDSRGCYVNLCGPTVRRIPVKE